MALPACGNAAGETTLKADCDGNVEQQLKDNEVELIAAKAEARRSADNPDGVTADAKVTQLENQRKALQKCPAGSTTTTTAAPAASEISVDPASLAAVFEGPVDPITELAFGEAAQATLANAPQERGAAAHSSRTLKSGPEIAAWFASEDPKAHLVRDRVYLQTVALCGQEDANRIMKGEGWLIMAVLPPSQVLGTSYVTGDGMVFSNSWRQAQGGDGYGLPVCLTGPNKGKVVAEAMVRLDCGNGHEAPRIRINRPDTPGAPPVDVPPTPEEPPPSDGKDYRRSPVVSDRNHPDERVRPNIPAPAEVIRPPSAQPTQPAPQPTIPDPPEVLNPEPIAPGVPSLPPTPVDPVEAPGADGNGDGIPD
jgi:hypothetical protein